MAAAAAILSTEEIATAIGAGISLIQSNHPTGLDDKYRSIKVSVVNQTQFEVMYTGHDYFASGKYWTAPTNAPKFSAMEFSGCNSDGTILTGIAGGTTFTINTGGSIKPVDFAIGFSNPAAGSIKIGLSLNTTKAENAYESADSHTVTHETSPMSGVDRSGKPVRFKFVFVATPAREAKVTITQVHC